MATDEDLLRQSHLGKKTLKEIRDVFGPGAKSIKEQIYSNEFDVDEFLRRLNPKYQGGLR